MPDKRFRDAESGKFTTEEYAREHPSTTVGEAVKPGERFQAHAKEQVRPLVLWGPLTGYVK